MVPGGYHHPTSPPCTILRKSERKLKPAPPAARRRGERPVLPLRHGCAGRFRARRALAHRQYITGANRPPPEGEGEAPHGARRR